MKIEFQYVPLRLVSCFLFTNVLFVQPVFALPASVSFAGQSISAQFTYDANGNRVRSFGVSSSNPEQLYTYDFDNRLKSFAAGPTSATYSSNGFGERVAKTVNGVIITYYQDGPEVVLEKTGANSTFYLHGPGLDELISSTVNGVTRYYHQDALGSVVALTDSTGAVISTYAYEPFGSTRTKTGVSSNPWSFTGRPLDPESGLLFLRNRYYDPRVGRFLTQDPIGISGGLNLYGYVRNNPLNFTDPFGYDYWIEGSVPGEPYPHQSINVGDPNGDYDSYSFGWTQKINLRYGLEGEVYRDPMKGGPIEPGFYRKATPQEDILIRTHLESQVGRKGSYGFCTCRTWSQNEFLNLTKREFGHPSGIPSGRNPIGQQSQSIPLLSSTITSSEPYGFPSSSTNKRK